MTTPPRLEDLIPCITDGISAFNDELTLAVRGEDLNPQARLVQCLLDIHAKDSAVYVAGNGGSAASASHFVCDLLKSAPLGTDLGMRAVPLLDPSAFSAYANDEGFSQSFAAQLRVLGRRGDLLIVLSVSGSSSNITQALSVAVGIGMRTCLITSQLAPSGPAADITISVPTIDFGVAETAHLGAVHAVSRALRAVLDVQHACAGTRSRRAES